MAQVTAIITKIIMDEDYHVYFYDQYGYVIQTLQTDVYVEVVGSYLVCGSNGDSIKFYANTVELIEGPTFSQSYTPLPSGFYQQGSQYFERLSAIYDYIKTNIVSVVIRGTTAVMFKDGTRFTSANVTAIVNWGDIEGTLSNQEDLQDALDTKVDENPAISGSTKTKISYDSKGLVTSGTDAEISDIVGLQTALDGKVDENAAITGATKTKITYDSKGLVTAGDDAGISDITGLQDALDDKVPYTGATQDVDLGTHKITMDDGVTDTEMSPSLFGVENHAQTIFSTLEYNQLTVNNSTIPSSIAVTATGITFPNATTQTTAFPPAGGTSSEYIKGDGTLGTLPTGGSVGFEQNFLLMGA